jgi:hypothetical protein
MARNTTSTHRPSFRRPTILVGSEATLLGRPTVNASDAAAAGLYGLDLDLRRAWQSPAEDDVERLESTRIRAVWLPPSYSGPLTDRRVERLRAFLTRAAMRHGLRSIALAPTSTTSTPGVPLSRVVQQVAELHGVRLALEVRATSILRQGGSHLDRVANVRRFAEEWDLDIALDLTGRDLAGWETEAALMRLFPRLTQVRIAPMHTPDGLHSGTPGATVALRAVAMLADQAFSGLISVMPGAPRSPWWSWASHPALDLALTAREEILATYDRINQYDTTAWQPHQQRP